MSLTLEPADVVRIARALDIAPVAWMTAGRMLEEVTARAAERSSGSPDPRTSPGSRAARELAEQEAARELAEEEALGDAWLAHHGLPVDDGGRGFSVARTRLDGSWEGRRDVPYPPGSPDEEELWRLHSASLGEDLDEGERDLSGDEEEVLWRAAAANLGIPEEERL